MCTEKAWHGGLERNVIKPGRGPALWEKRPHAVLARTKCDRRPAPETGHAFAHGGSRGSKAFPGLSLFRPMRHEESLNDFSFSIKTLVQKICYALTFVFIVGEAVRSTDAWNILLVGPY